MWKWLGGCLVVVIVLIAGAMMWGYRVMQQSLSPDGSASVTIGAPASRIFASIAHGDSIATWMAQGSTVPTSRHGPLEPGDTLRIEMQSRLPAPQQAMIWRVKEIVVDRLRVLELLSDSAHEVVATRRDSISTVGDSTRVLTRITSPALDSIRAAPGSKPKSGDGMGGLSADLLLSMFRMQSKLELMHLKARVEGGRPELLPRPR